MRKSRFTETQIVGILKSADAGKKVKDICREHGISDVTYYKWKSRYGGMEASDLKRVKELESELAQYMVTGSHGYGVRYSVFTFTSTTQGAAHYNYYRDYDPDTGRYLQPDPIGLAGGLNPYRYADANPLRFSDSLGLTERDIHVAIDIARRTQTDIRFPADNRYPVRDLSGYGDEGDTAAVTMPGVGTNLDDRYLRPLTGPQACELLNTIIHEGIHYTLPPTDPNQKDNDGCGYPYKEAARRTTPDLCKIMNQERRTR